MLQVYTRDLNFQIFQIEFQIESNRVNSSHIIFKHLYKLLFKILNLIFESIRVTPIFKHVYGLNSLFIIVL